MHRKETIVIIGTGWAGYTVSQSLDANKFDIKVISPEPAFPYTPLLASAACGLFEFSLAQEPVRRKGKQLQYLKAKVEEIDFDGKTCTCRAVSSTPHTTDTQFKTAYDRLILAPGAITNTFDTPGAMEHAHFLKNVTDARRVQATIQELLESACLPEVSEEKQRELMHIVIVGGGPTGIEIAAELSDLFHDELPGTYPGVAEKFRITILDAAPTILGQFEDELRKHSLESFSKRGVEVKLEAKIQSIENNAIVTEADGRIGCGMVLWTAGNKENPLLEKLKVAKTEKLPRILTDDYLHVLDMSEKAMPDIYALGDAADIKDNTLPTTAEAAVQKAEYLAVKLNKYDDTIASRDPFKYKQKALVAYLGAQDGVVSGNQEWTGANAWAAWRSSNLFWVRSWKRRAMIVMSWGMDWANGRNIARQ